jgi:hypothetical protein
MELTNSKKIMLFILTCVALHVTSCYRTSESLIGNLVHKSCKEIDTCQVNLNEILPFVWDSIVVFGRNATMEDIALLIPDTNVYYDIHLEQIFGMYNGNVIHYELEEFDWNERLRQSVIFELKRNYGVIHREDSNFKVTKIKLSRGFAYYLTPV